MEYLKVKKEGNVGVITLSHESRLNAYGFGMARELLEALYAFSEDRDVRCLLLTGAGRAFCAGGDITVMREAIEGEGSPMRSLITYLHSTVSEIRRMKKPVIAAVNGVAAGAGLGLALAADLVYAASRAIFVYAYSGIGLSPDGGFSALLAPTIGYSIAMDMVLTGREIGALEAKELGFVNEVYPDEELMNRALAVAGDISRGPTGAFAAAKEVLGRALSSDIETQMEFERLKVIERTKSADFKEGVSAFLEKRKPRFRGM